MQNDWKKSIALGLSSQAVTMFGSSLVQYAIVWYVARETNSGLMFSLITLSGFLPHVLISVFAGVWADRYSRKSIIIIADAGIALFTLALFFIIRSSDNFFVALFVISAVRSVGSGIQAPAVTAIIPQIVPQEKLMRIGGINSSIMSVVNLAAPAVAGAVLSMGAIEHILLIDVATAAAGIFVFAFVPVPKLKKALSKQKGGYFSDLKLGLRFSFKDHFIRNTLIVITVLAFLISPPALMNVLFVTRVFGDNYFYLTLNEIAFFIGATAGGLLLSAWGGFKNRIKTMVVGGLAASVMTIIMGVTEVFWVYLAVMLFTGLAVPFTESPLMVLVQEKIDHEMQGRVFSILGIAATLTMPLGMALFGPLADAVPIQWLMIGSGIGLGAVAAAIILWKSFYSQGVPGPGPEDRGSLGDMGTK